MEKNASKKTKSEKFKYILCKVASFSLCIMPLLIYIVLGFLDGDIQKGEKVFLGFTCITALILTIVNLLMKYHLRSPMFLLMLGIYYAMNNVLTVFIIISAGVVLDEFIFSPLARKHKQKYIINKEIDDRL